MDIKPIRQNRQKPSLSLVVAASCNHVIGRDGDLPWRQSTDLKRFRTLTANHPLVMGRRTFESLPGPLAGRDNIVISRTLAPQSGIIVARNVDEALNEGAKACERKGLSTIMIIGGGEIYRETLSLAHDVFLTVIETTAEGDTYFPLLDDRDWQLKASESIMPGPKDDYPMRFCHYVRRLPPDG